MRLTLYQALLQIGFSKQPDSDSKHTLARDDLWVSLRIGDRAHWYVPTPLGIKDYHTERQALHALVLYQLLSRNDLEKLASIEYEPAKDELLKFDKTLQRSLILSKAEQVKQRKYNIEKAERIEEYDNERQRQALRRLYHRKLEVALKSKLTDVNLTPICPICKKDFSDYSSLLNHIRTKANRPKHTDFKLHLNFYKSLVSEAKNNPTPAYL